MLRLVEVVITVPERGVSEFRAGVVILGVRKCSLKFWAHHGHRLGTANKKGPTLSRKAF